MVKGEGRGGGEHAKKCREEGEELHVVAGARSDFKCNVTM